MKIIATYLRALQLFAHNAHNLAKGENFLSDHSYLGELYGEYEEDYDSVVERIIGESEPNLDLASITQDAAKLASAKTPVDNDKWFSSILATEKVLCNEIKKEVSGASDGTQNLLQGLADKSLDRQYKIGRRLF